MKSTELAKEITATMSLRLPGTVGKIASKMRYIDAKAPLFLRGGVVRPIPQGEFSQVKAVGLASASNRLPAFGGVLYGAAALRYDVTVSGNSVIETFQDSRIDINDINYLETKQRLLWKEYVLIYTLLKELFREPDLPDIVLLNVPLLLARAQQSGRMESEDIQEEWQDVMAAMSSFWDANLDRVFPQNPHGPMLVSLSTRHSGAVLHAIAAKGALASPDPIDPETVALVTQEWGRLREVGIMRILEGLLRGGKRTAAYYYEALGPDMMRAEPTIVSSHGLVGMHVRVGVRTPVWQLETLGNREEGKWTPEELDRLCALVSYLTLYDNPTITPLPLWYAKKLVRMPRSVLLSYRTETLRLFRDQTVDAAWLEGMDALDDTKDGEEDNP